MLVSTEYIQYLVEQANAKMESNWQRIDAFQAACKAAFAPQVSMLTCAFSAMRSSASLLLRGKLVFPLCCLCCLDLWPGTHLPCLQHQNALQKAAWVWCESSCRLVRSSFLQAHASRAYILGKQQRYVQGSCFSASQPSHSKKALALQ